MGAGFNVSRFKSKLEEYGVIKTSKFLVRIPSPPRFRASYGQQSILLNKASRDMEFWCEGAKMPGIGLNVHDIWRYGYGAMEKRPYAPIFTDILLTFIGDGKGIIWSFFQQWIQLIANYSMASNETVMSNSGIIINQRPYELAYKEDYAVDISIIVFDDMGTEIFNIVLREAYPTLLEDIQLSWNNNNEIMRIPVNLTFRDFHNETFPTVRSKERTLQEFAL